MLRRVGLSVLVVILGALGGPSRGLAGGWGDQCFLERGHDFGPVPRGAKVTHSFAFTNRLAEPLTILDLRASCGCTSGKARLTRLGPGEATSIDAEMDTRNFVGRKETVLYVSLVSASGRQSEVRLAIASTILSDVVLNPGTIDFGAVPRGQTPARSLTVDRVGQPGWRVEKIASGCRLIDATLTETLRQGDRVSYELRVSLLPGAPAGPIRDEIRLVGNDRETKVIPVPIWASIKSEVTASPSLLALGSIRSASPAEGRILLRASRPFLVREVVGQGDGFTLSADDATEKPIHILTVRFQPEVTKQRGELRRRFQVATNLEGEPPVEVEVTLFAEP